MSIFKTTLVSVMALFVFALAGCETSTPEQIEAANAADNSNFVSVSGKHFMLNGKPFYVVGTNFWYGGYLGSSGTVGDRDRLIKELDLLQKTGINNLRVMAVSESSALMRAVRPAIMTEPGVYDEELLAGMDFLLDEMRKRNIKAVLYLNNFWQWSGGMSQYVSWVNGTPVFDPDATGEWNAFMQNSAKFYQLEKAQRIYRDVIKHIITRKNTINGRLYSEDPTIMSWQLANEPRPGSDVDGRINFAAFKNWINDTAKYIHELAPKQLVSTGNEGSMGTIRDMALYTEAHKSPYVDYLTFHMWIKNWSWYDATKPEATYESALATSKEYIAQHIAVANQLNKPIVLEEFGVERDGGSFEAKSTTVYRDRFYQSIFAFLYQHAAQGDAIAGSNFWAWGGYGRAQNADFMWQKGDDFVGDPPQEPQGLNSIFNTDTSTLAIIKAHADAMATLSQTENR